MNIFTIIATAWKAFWMGVRAGRKAKAGAELEQGAQEVGTAERNSERVANELAEPPRSTAPLTPAPSTPSGPVRG